MIELLDQAGSLGAASSVCPTCLPTWLKLVHAIATGETLIFVCDLVSV